MAARNFLFFCVSLLVPFAEVYGQSQVRILNNYSTHACWILKVDTIIVRNVESAIIMSCPTSVNLIIVLLKTPPK